MTVPTGPIPYLGADDIEALLSPADAVHAISAALRHGFDPADDPARIRVDARHGQLLLMPSDIGASAGVKIATVTPGNPAGGLPRINGVYVLFDAETLIPSAILDGIALTAVRTPAVSVAAVSGVLQRSSTPLRMVVFGAGPQALGHVRTVRGVLDGARDISDLTYIVRRPDAYPGLTHVEAAGSVEADQAVRSADLVVCASTASEPLFDSALLPDQAVVIAVGSHEPDVREVDSALVGSAQVVVEDIGTALREAGDVIMAIDDGAITPDRLVPMRDVVTDTVPLAGDRPVLFKGSGMSWQDLIVAEAIARRFAQD